ncbi:MAG: dihydrodipicolinate synthase family protein, partial [Gammaproteobacteria bacterium]
MLSVNDIKGLYAITPTPSKPGAERWDATDTVDLDELARLTEALVQSGVNGMVAMGTTGECATLTPSEWEQAAACVIETVRKRVPLFVGTTALGTHEIVRRNRFIQDLGADGTMLGLPMWQPCTLDMAVQFYADMSEAFPQLAIMAYDNPGAFRFNFPPPFWAQVARRAPTVICTKHGPDPMISALIGMTQGKI